jgi:hypothetical protein
MGNLNGVDPQTASMDLIGKRVTMKNVCPADEKAAKNGTAPQFVLEG